MESLPTRAKILCTTCTDQFAHTVPSATGKRLTENDEGKQARLEEGNETDSEDKDATFVTVARFVKAWYTCLPHFPLTKAKAKSHILIA